MLVSNVGTWRTDLTLEDPWWVSTLADSHAAVFLNSFWDLEYNGTGEDHRVTVARALKARNSRVQTWVYQPADRLGDTAFVQAALDAHPEWWLRDDAGNPIPFAGGGRKQIDPSVAGARAFFANLSVSLFHDRAEAERLLDGVFVDGAGGPRQPPNVSAARYARIQQGAQQMLAELRANLRALNGGHVVGNPMLDYSAPEGSPAASWNTTMGNTDGGFDEMFGSFLTMVDYPSGTSSAWDAERMRWSMQSIINASAAGKIIVVHAFPGPAGALLTNRTTGEREPMFPSRGDAATGNTFHVAQWAGAERVPEDPEADRRASAARLVESLAPFLIVASETVFLGYGWFYNLEDGYIPCKAGVQCGMPSQWFPEYTRPLGAPLGPADSDATGMRWTRRFAHADVSVDLRDRTASTIRWHAVGDEYPAFTSGKS